MVTGQWVVAGTRGVTLDTGDVVAGSMFGAQQHGTQMTLVAPYDSVRALWEAANIPHLGASHDPAARRVQPTDQLAIGKEADNRQSYERHAESCTVPSFVPQPGPGTVTPTDGPFSFLFIYFIFFHAFCGNQIVQNATTPFKRLVFMSQSAKHRPSK
ncbi:hypothetical protein LY78DRAFT_332536 [Colletotrichum sublineola]|nr:hypothetical protein LY78DRAFT_332536 [Colletotrichum sublineola]